MTPPPVKIYTDGSCSPNPGPGGWAAVLLFAEGQKTIEISGFEKHTTNNRMELLAALKALQSLQKDCCVTITTDSQYLYNGITKWLENWRNRDWITSDGLPVKNRDLWESFAAQLDYHDISWHWVKGHGTDRWNRIADSLAVAARAKANTTQSTPDGVNIYLGVTWKNTERCGAWSTILTYRHHLTILNGSDCETTANRLYLVAAIAGIKALKKQLPVNLHTRSGYLRDGLAAWLQGWQRRGWHTRDGKKVSNAQQWQELLALSKVYSITVVSVSNSAPPCHFQEAKVLAKEHLQLQC